MPWKVVPLAPFVRSAKSHEKSWPAEMRAAVANAYDLVQQLDQGTKPAQLSLLGYVHSGYPLGILAVDETGHGQKKRPKALRLYVYPSEEQQLLYLLLIGGKDGQPADVAKCKSAVEELLARQPPESL